MKGLTRRQRQIVDFIQDYIQEKNFSPSYREIMNHFGFSSLGSVYKHISVLKRRGVLNSEKNSARSVTLAQPFHRAQDGSVVDLPFLGLIAAGKPIEPFPQQGSISVPRGIVKDPARSYVLQVKGNSMNVEHVCNGDLIVIESRHTAVAGEMVIALVNGNETTLRYYYPEGKYVRLETTHADREPLYVLAEGVQIQGVLLGLVRKYR
ncbi:MAG: repressor LexA [Verrucomicrobia bacterium]|nr:repressor LexA [Verrucomicrobiota bacterium]